MDQKHSRLTLRFPSLKASLLFKDLPIGNYFKYIGAFSTPKDCYVYIKTGETSCAATGQVDAGVYSIQSNAPREVSCGRYEEIVNTVII